MPLHKTFRAFTITTLIVTIKKVNHNPKMKNRNLTKKKRKEKSLKPKRFI